MYKKKKALWPSEHVVPGAPLYDGTRRNSFPLCFFALAWLQDNIHILMVKRNYKANWTSGIHEPLVTGSRLHGESKPLDSAYMFKISVSCL